VFPEFFKADLYNISGVFGIPNILYHKPIYIISVLGNHFIKLLLRHTNSRALVQVLRSRDVKVTFQATNCIKKPSPPIVSGMGGVMQG
jgi:hypothetical protein